MADHTYVGPPEDPRVATLRSIASSIRTAFPTASDELQEIATSLEAEHKAREEYKESVFEQACRMIGV